jgi:hypothetical protein
MQRLVVILLVLGCCSSAALGMSWKPCSAPTAGLKMFVPDAVELQPDPPTIGDSVLFSIKGQADRNVTSGSLDISVQFQGMDIYQESKDLCSRTKCPIKVGPISIAYSQDLPPIAPPGDYEVQVSAKGPDGEELMCIVVDFELVYPGAKSWIHKAKSTFGGRKSALRVVKVAV